MGWKHTRPLTTPKEDPFTLAGDCMPSTTSSLQISIFQIHEIFNISYFPQFNLSFEKKKSLSKNVQKSPKHLHKTA